MLTDVVQVHAMRTHGRTQAPGLSLTSNIVRVSTIVDSSRRQTQTHFWVSALSCVDAQYLGAWGVGSSPGGSHFPCATRGVAWPRYRHRGDVQGHRRSSTGTSSREAVTVSPGEHTLRSS